jgi:hypothetical protein
MTVYGILAIVLILSSLNFVCSTVQLRGSPVNGFSVLNDDIFEHENDTVESVIKYALHMAPKPLPVTPSHPQPPPIAAGTVFENKIFAKPGVSYQRFGHKIASNRNFVAVGTSVAGPASKVYLFEEFFEVNSTVSSGWTQRGSVSSGSGKSDGFGSSLAMDGEVLLVGAPQDDNAGFSSGLVYVYSAGPDSLFDTHTVATQVLRAPVTQKGASFGSALSLLNDTLVVGSPGASTETGPNSGIVYIFSLDAEG